MELPGRLAAVAARVPAGSVLADIGTDHALLPVYLLQGGICPKAIATELNYGPFLSAEEAIEQGGLKALIETRRGDGLQVLRPGEAQVVVIAGMGGNTIRGILAGAPLVLEHVERLVLQPMADAGDLRLWLCANGWKIADEALVEENGRIYVVIVAEHGLEATADPLLLELGPRLLEKKDPLLKLHLEKVVADIRRVLAGLVKSGSPVAREKALYLKEKEAKIERLVDCL